MMTAIFNINSNQTQWLDMQYTVEEGLDIDDKISDHCYCMDMISQHPELLADNVLIK